MSFSPTAGVFIPNAAENRRPYHRRLHSYCRHQRFDVRIDGVCMVNSGMNVSGFLNSPSSVLICEGSRNFRSMIKIVIAISPAKELGSRLRSPVPGSRARRPGLTVRKRAGNQKGAHIAPMTANLAQCRPIGTIEGDFLRTNVNIEARPMAMVADVPSVICTLPPAPVPNSSVSSLDANFDSGKASPKPTGSTNIWTMLPLAS